MELCCQGTESLYVNEPSLCGVGGSEGFMEFMEGGPGCLTAELLERLPWWWRRRSLRRSSLHEVSNAAHLGLKRSLWPVQTASSRYPSSTS